MDNEIEKAEQPNPDEILVAIQSFNDPSIITNMFKELGWSYSLEIRETLVMAKQNANLSIKFKAIKHLRELLREAAEAAGYVANVSQTIKNPQGGQTTFSAKRIAGILNPVKKIESTEIKELQDGKNTKTEPDRESDRGESNGGNVETGGKLGSRDDRISSHTRETSTDAGGVDTLEQFPPERDTGRADSGRDVGLGGLEPQGGGETPRPIPGGGNPSDDSDSKESINPCIEVRPPTGDKDLFPGISTSAEH